MFVFCCEVIISLPRPYFLYHYRNSWWQALYKSDVNWTSVTVFSPQIDIFIDVIKAFDQVICYWTDYGYQRTGIDITEVSKCLLSNVFSGCGRFLLERIEYAKYYTRSNGLALTRNEANICQDLLGKDWPTDWLIAWLPAWLPDWLTAWLTDWLAGWLTDWLTDWMNAWLTDWLPDWLAGWLTHACITSYLLHQNEEGLTAVKL